ncbi:hypothetical protein K3495_g11129 [Podosphaera aphanis]|nr:hypothetical protein K3495_g11129 [Podosphaera aphanis]
MYRRKLIAANSNMRHTYPDEGLLMLLMKMLPKSFQMTIDGFHLHDELSAEEKIQRLVEKEEWSKSANVASCHHRSNKTPRRRDSDVSMRNASDRSICPSKMCYLCKGKHFQRHCPFVVQVQKFGEELRKKHERRESKRKDPKSKNLSKSSRSNVKSNQKLQKKSHGYSAMNPLEGESESSHSEDSGDTSEEESDSDGSSKTNERVYLTKGVICKTTPADWVFDTGATSPMTDHLHFYRGPLLGDRKNRY